MLDKEAFKTKLDTELIKVRKEIDDLEELTKPVSPENAIGRISRMDAINNKSVNEAALANKKEQLKKLERAQEKIDEPGFGICVRCKQPIPEGRLMLMPGAIRCVNCA